MHTLTWRRRRVYDTADGYLALAMTHLPTLGKLLELPVLQEISNPADGFRRRDEIKQAIAQRLKEHTTEHWLEILNAADIWCAEVLDWPKLCASEAFEQLAMIQTLKDGEAWRSSPPVFRFAWMEIC